MIRVALYRIIRFLGAVLGIAFLVVSITEIALGGGVENTIGLFLGAIFFGYGLLGEPGLRRGLSFLVWPVFFPVSLAFSGWSCFQLWQAVSIQLIRAWPHSSDHLWAIEPRYFALIVCLHIFVLIQTMGFLYVLWLLYQAHRSESARAL